MNDELSPGSGTSGPDEDVAGAGTEPPAAAGPATAGGLIRAARQAQGLDLASLAAMLKIPLRKLEALENGRHEDLQGPTFERALAQAACRVLKIDPRPVLALMPQVAGNTLEHVTGGLNKPFRERPGRADLDGASLLRPVVVLPLLIVVAALALFFLPDSLWKRLSQPIAAALSGEGPAAAASAPTAVLAATAAPPASEPAALAPVAVPPPATVAPVVAAAASAAAVPAATPAAPGVDEVLAHAAPPPTIPLQVTASADSWVEVLDAQGHTLLSRTVVSGESVGLDGAMPMRVKVGNARATKLTLRGDNIDLTQYTRDNVARLELK